MKRLLSLYIFLSCSLMISAQTAAPVENASLNRQIGIDATSFLARIFNFSQTNSFSQPTYYVTYRKLKEKSNFRFGVGGDIIFQGVNGGTNSSVLLNLRFGKDKAKDFGKHWQAYYGWDVKTNLAFASIGSSDNSTTQLGLGWAPVGGLQFKINSRLVISTEAAYNFYFTIFDQNGETNPGFLTSFSPPTSFYVNYIF